MELVVIFTQDQYDRFKTALTKLSDIDGEVTDDMLVAQMKREASAITYAAEQGHLNPDWKF